MSEQRMSREHRELLQKIEEAIASRAAGGAGSAKSGGVGDAGGANWSGEPGQASSVEDMVALIASDVPVAGEDFRARLLERVRREVYGQEGQQMNGETYVGGHYRYQIMRQGAQQGVQPAGKPLLRQSKPSVGWWPRRGRFAAAATGVLAASLLLAVLAGMAATIKLRNESISASRTATAVAQLAGRGTPTATMLAAVAPSDTPLPPASPIPSPDTALACGSWAIVPSPNVDVANELHAVSAASSNGVWAVGFHSKGKTKDEKGLLQKQDPDQTLAMHWDGRNWSYVPSPNVGPGDNYLEGIAAISQHDAWAVGYYDAGRVKTTEGAWKEVGPYRTLTMHWNGSNWKVVPSPDVAGSGSRLTAVAALSASDVWAAGYSGDDYATGATTPTPAKTLILHWDGTTWTQVPSPNASQWLNRLSAISAASENDIWAVGDYLPHELRQGGGNELDPLFLHWDGKSWSQIPSQLPNISGLLATTGVAAISKDSTWVVGADSSECCNDARIMRWDGAGWSLADIPSTRLPADAQPGSILLGIVAVAKDDVWAIGNYSNDSEQSSISKNKTLAMHWDGARWSIIPSPNRETEGKNENIASYNQQFSDIRGIAAVSSREIWAVGTSRVIDDQSLTFIMHYTRSECPSTPTTTSNPAPK